MNQIIVEMPKILKKDHYNFKRKNYDFFLKNVCKIYS